jgi:hypothetical protein
VVTAEDLVGPDGSCASDGTVPAAAPGPAAEPEPPAPATDGANPRTPASAPANDALLQPAVGIALGLSECEVVRRAGHPDRVDVGTDDRNERSVVLTYSHGERAGIYRFREGRLFTIERVAVTEEPKKPVKPKASAKPKAVKRAAKPSEASSFADPAAAPAKPAPKTAWPEPSQPNNPAAQASPWPAPQQTPPQSTVWPAPPKPPSG